MQIPPSRLRSTVSLRPSSPPSSPSPDRTPSAPRPCRAAAWPPAAWPDPPTTRPGPSLRPLPDGPADPQRPPTWKGGDPPRATGSPPHGLLTTGHLTRVGLSRAQIVALERQGVLVRVHDGVYRTADTLLSTRRRLLAACLAVGGLVGASHRAALWLWDLTATPPPIEVTTLATRRPIPSGTVVHVRGDLSAGDLRIHRGVPVTSVARTLADARNVVDVEAHALAVAKARYLRLVTDDELHRRGLPSPVLVH